jgi:hypothetical protein
MSAIEGLTAVVKTRIPAASVIEERLPSGNVWLDIRVAGRVFVVEYSPPHRYGVSSLSSKSGWEGYGEGADRQLTRYRDAERHLLGLLRAAIRPKKPVKRAPGNRRRVSAPLASNR